MWKCKCGESNPDTSTFCQTCGTRMRDVLSKEELEERERLIRARREEDRLRTEAYNRRQERADEDRRVYREALRQSFRAKLNNLKKQGYDGYCQYRVISLSDENGFFNPNSGRVNTVQMMQVLNDLGLEGWHLVTAYTNELGKNSIAGINSTVDENILIFERYVKIKEDDEYEEGSV